MTTADLPALNAALNATAAVLLAYAWVCIRRRQVRRHRALMLAALAVSALFLTSYVIYHGLHGSTPFRGVGLVRVVYFAVLIPHVVLATLMVPFILTTLVRALRGDFARHRKLARWTLPVWLYVSVTGVVVYFMLYHWPTTG